MGIRDNLIARIDEARREGWIGEAEGLNVSLAAAKQKLAQLDASRPVASPSTSACPPSPTSPAAPSPPLTKGPS